MYRTFILLFCVLLPAAALGQTKSLSLTVYNQNRALVNEVRSMELPQGQGRVEFMDVAQKIEAPTLQVRSATAPEKFSVLDMNYEYDLVNTRNLLDRYVGKQLRVTIQDWNCADCVTVREATLLANTDRPIFRIDDEIWVGNYRSVLLPALPEGLRPYPTLVWLVDNEGPATQDIEVSYLTGGLGWRADYVLKVSKDETAGALSGWVTLNNTSGKSYQDASLKLVAGDVNRAQEPMVRRMEMTAAAPMVEDKGMSQESVFEYHMYTLDRPVTVLQNQTKQVSLLQEPNIRLKKRLVARYGGYSGSSGTIDQPVHAYLTFTNDTKSGLGMRLPKGIVRAYQQSSDGSAVFVGEDNIDHTTKNEKVELKMGESFDVKIERNQTSFDKLGKRTVQYAWEIAILNAKDEPQEVELEESFPGDWKILEASHEYEDVTARTVRFTVTVPPSGEDGERLVVRYEARVDM